MTVCLIFLTLLQMPIKAWRPWAGFCRLGGMFVFSYSLVNLKKPTEDELFLLTCRNPPQSSDQRLDVQIYSHCSKTGNQMAKR